jgi:hypothetical protein
MFSHKDWKQLIDRIKGPVYKLEDSYNSTDCVNIRHDIDNDLGKAVKMASEENKIGVQSTYFFLNTAGYWNDKQQLKAALWMIHAMGHEIGWHNNAIAHHLDSGIPLKDCIQRPLDEMRKYVPVIGSASHGDHLCHEVGFLNYYIFQETPIHPRFKYVKEPRFKMIDFLLEYEAYFTGHTHYITDTGGKWGQDNENIISDFEKKGGKLQILLHPQHYSL